jgi:uncharacterized membrane protein YozB (DUF420 family)
MDAKLLFWTLALLNLAVITVCGQRAIAAIRRGDVRTHRRMMLTATALVGVFLGSYVAKVILLGKEDRAFWTPIDYAILYTHELCITAMLIAGAIALFQAWRFRHALPEDGTPPNDPASQPVRARHTRAGTLAKWSGLLAFLTAIGVWTGMLLRGSA